MKSKAPHLLKNFQTAVLRLWEKDYNSKVLPKPAITTGVVIRTGNKASSFDNFLQIEENSDLFDATAPINMYRNYCITRLTSFSKCLNIVVWRECYGLADDPNSHMA